MASKHVVCAKLPRSMQFLLFAVGVHWAIPLKLPTKSSKCLRLTLSILRMGYAILVFAIQTIYVMLLIRAMLMESKDRWIGMIVFATCLAHLLSIYFAISLNQMDLSRVSEAMTTMSIDNDLKERKKKLAG